MSIRPTDAESPPPKPETSSRRHALPVPSLAPQCAIVVGTVAEDELPKTSPLIQSCLQDISVHLHEPIPLEQLSRHCGLCTRSLSLRFREETGMGVPEYIHREKLREAEYLLRHTDYSLSEITSYLNYPSQSYFTQIFKKYKGQTPQQYRDQVR